MEYLSENKQCVGYLRNGCTTIATLGQPKSICEECQKKYDELNDKLALRIINRIRGVAIDAVYIDELADWEKDNMTVYECFCQQKEMTAEKCQDCFKKEMKEKYQTRAACVQDNAEKKEGSTF